MSSYVSVLENAVKEIPANQLIIASELYSRLSSEITEQAFYKTMERFSKSGKLVHLTKGVYYRPKKTRFGTVPISDDEIAGYYLKNQQGLMVGYRMFNQKGITTQIGKQVEILSTILPEEQKHIRNVSVRKITVPLNEETIPVMEAMEILQAYQEMEDVNTKVLAAYMTNFVQVYSDSAMELVLANRKYKKSTIAFMTAFLNYHQVKHSLSRHLSPMSDYKIPNVEELYVFA
ncbi:MAG: DUF6088 family protein [Eubacteriales bacterium]|nr:DUF6088 family protein [Eubacteriales bacterium]